MTVCEPGSTRRFEQMFLYTAWMHSIVQNDHSDGVVSVIMGELVLQFILRFTLLKYCISHRINSFRLLIISNEPFSHAFMDKARKSFSSLDPLRQ